MARRCAGCFLHFPGMDSLFPRGATTNRLGHTQKGPLSLLWKKRADVESTSTSTVAGRAWDLSEHLPLPCAGSLLGNFSPPEMLCAHRPHCKKGRSSKRGHQGCVCTQVSKGKPGSTSVGLPSSLENFQEYVILKFNQEIYDGATDIFPRCFVSFMQENLEEKLMMLTHIHMQACGCLVFDSSNSLLLLFGAAWAFVSLG